MALDFAFVGIHRRAVAALLAVLAIGVAGCAGGQDPSASETSVPEAELTRTHEGEASFIGTVTGYMTPEDSRDYCIDEEGCVAVDNATVGLTLIDTWEISCMDARGLDRQLAITAKENAIPIGTRVQVYRDLEPDDRGYERTGFIHVLDENDEPLAASVNEQLVSTGYWVPDYRWSNSQQVGNFRTTLNYVTGVETTMGESLYALIEPSRLTRVQEQYGQRLIDAANAARIVRAGGQDACIAKIEEYAAAQTEGAVNYQETSRRLELEYEQWKRDHPGWDQCIDRDNDGICYED